MSAAAASTGEPAGELAGVSWRPVGRRTPVLRDVSLRIAPGDRVLIAGRSGGGKSTLLRALAGVLATADAGELTGSVRRGGVVVDATGRTRPPPVGLLLQEPDDALVASRVGRDVAFGPENLGLARDEIWRRVRGALAAVGSPHPLDHPTAALSGGERQRLALAGALALAPPLLLLDEPLAMLDPGSAAAVREAVLSAVVRTGAALVVVDHHLDRWVDVVNRLVVLRDGQVVADGTPAAVLARDRDRLVAAGLWVPGVPPPDPLPVDPDLLRPRTATGQPGQPALTAEAVRLRRRRAGTDALAGVSGEVPVGRVTCLTGPSGAGKSTLAQLLAGLSRPTSGRVVVHPALADRVTGPLDRWRSRDLATRLGWVSQHPERAFVARRVDTEVAATTIALGRPDPHRVGALLSALDLAEAAATDPFRLSGGEQRRLALAAAVAHGPAVLVLDEPTVGQDRTTWAAVAGIVAAAREAGTAVLACTHDRVFVDALGDTEIALVDGHRIAPLSTPVSGAATAVAQ